MRALCLFFIAAVPIGCQSTCPNRVNEFIEALYSNDQVMMETFVTSRFVPQRSVADLSARLIALSRIGIPITVGKTRKDEPTTVIAQLKSSTGEGWEIKMTFEAAEPHRVTSLAIDGPGGQSNPPKTYSSWNSIADLLTQVRANTSVPAIGLAFSQGDDVQRAVVGDREVGKSDKAEVGDRWLIGSITKSMTATMIARLVDRKVLRWDTTIAEALPLTPMRPEYRNITLLQLLQHRSGVQQDRLVTSEFLDQAAGSATSFVKVREHYTAFTLAREPLFKPGTKMAYSNAGYTIAAHMAETVAKTPYERLMMNLVFRPLGMGSARMAVPGSPDTPGSAGQPMGHYVGEHGPEPRLMSELKLTAMQEPAGLGVSMSLDDLLKFARYHLAGLRGHVTLMSPANFAVLHKPAETGRGAYKYACGWVIDNNLTKEQSQGHNGSDGTFFAEMAVWPSQNFAAVSIANEGSNLSPSPPLQAILAVYSRYKK